MDAFDWSDQQQLKDYLYPTVVSKISRKKSKLSPTNDKISSIQMLTSSQSSDFHGFSNENAEKYPKSNECSAVKQVECSSVRTYGSDEISDQDVRCKIEMENFGERLDVMAKENQNLFDVSQHSIEPETPDDNSINNGAPILNNLINITDTIGNFTLSVNENSSNAVDNQIASTSLCSPTKELITDLSFNGKINVDNTISANFTDRHSTETGNLRVSTMNTSNTSVRSELEMQLQLATSREQINEQSPELFCDNDDDYLDMPNDDNDFDDENVKHENNNETDVNDSLVSVSFEETGNGDDAIQRKEKTISKRIQNMLLGVLPPPSVTDVQHDIINMISLYKKNCAQFGFGTEKQTETNSKDERRNKTFVPIELENVEWPKVQKFDAYGLHYNRTKYTENIEILYMKLIERNVGQETGSSFIYNASLNCKRKPIRKM